MVADAITEADIRKLFRDLSGTGQQPNADGCYELVVPFTKNARFPGENRKLWAGATIIVPATECQCECEFDPDADEEYNEYDRPNVWDGEPYDYRRVCENCDKVWFSLHCVHDGHGV